MQINNRTPFAVQSLLIPNLDGIDTLYTLVKATFNIGKKWTLADEQLLPSAEDEYSGDAESSSLKSTSDFHIGKPTSDIIVMGSAHSFDQKPVRQLDVGVAVGHLQKVIRVFGDRKWQNGFASTPEEFTSMPIVYENAFGGQYHEDEELKSLELRNPVGKGYKGGRSNSEMNGVQLPNLEDPRSLISTVMDCPEPVGFGPKAAHWAQRSQYGGTYDEAWQKQRAPYLPKDYSLTFNNCAHQDLIYPEYLVGGEDVKIVNMHPSGTLNFQLPIINLNGSLRVVRKRNQPITFNLETVIIEPDLMRLQMVWKSEYVANNNASKIHEIEVSQSRS